MESAINRWGRENGDFVGIGVGVDVVGICVVICVRVGVCVAICVRVGAVTWNVTTPIYPFASVK